MSKIIIFKGLPASGKSTLAKNLLEQGNTVRINKDLLREMLHCNKFTGKNESLTQEAAKGLATYFLINGTNVIIDDTNLNPRTVQSWVDLAKRTDSKIEYHDLTDVPINTCCLRDLDRDKKVGRHVIKKMALQYLNYMKDEKVVICDLDGTICNIDHRLKYGKGDTKDWNKFFSLISEDEPYENVIEKVSSLLLSDIEIKLIFVSARPEKYREVTELWLDNNFPYNHDLLIMRENNDKREDSIVKRDIYDKYLKNLNIIKVFDDRPRVIRMWRELGLEVEDCGNGIEF